MKCITTISTTLGASMVCVQTEPGLGVKCDKENNSERQPQDNHGHHFEPANILKDNNGHHFQPGSAMKLDKKDISERQTQDNQGHHFDSGQVNMTEQDYCESDQECLREGEDYR